MRMQFKGRTLIPLEVQGQALVTRSGFNTLACFYQSVLTEPERATCSDAGNRELFGPTNIYRISIAGITTG